MDKVKNFLERYVEWVAIAVGALFLGWTLYSYVLNKPVSVTVGSDAGVEPGDIGKKVWDVPGETLDKAIRNPAAPTTQMLPALDYASQIVSSLSATPSEVKTEFGAAWTPVPPLIDDQLDPSKSHTEVGKTLVAQLPDAAAPTALMLSHGHSNIQPPAAGGAGGVASNILAIDKNWITVQGTLPVSLLAKSFDAAKIPPTFAPVAIYRVLVTRQEKDAANNWGNDTEIQPLEINALTPLPAINCDFQDRSNYKTWAETQSNGVLIAEPPFYTVVHGDLWYEPGQKNPNEQDTQMVADQFDPRDPLAFKGDPNTLLPDERKIYNDAKIRQDKLDHRTRPQQPSPLPNANPNGYPNTGRGRGGGAGGGGAGGRNGLPMAQPANPGNLLLQPRNRPGSYGSGGPEMPYTPPTGWGNGGANPDSSSTTASLPAGSFSPADRVAAAVAANTDPDIKIWVHDATVVAGKTYRYKMKYVISNPVAGTTNLCKDPAMAQQAYIVSAESGWTSEISVESDTNFYAVDSKHGIRFDIFKWKNGIWQMQTVAANPGDRIGTSETSGARTDFDTGWTLVDVREDPGGNIDNRILVLVSDTGTVKQKEIITDRNNSSYRKLLFEHTTAADKTAQR